MASGTFIQQNSKATVKKKKDLYYPFFTQGGWINPLNMQTVVSVTYYTLKGGSHPTYPFS